MAKFSSKFSIGSPILKKFYIPPESGDVKSFCLWICPFSLEFEDFFDDCHIRPWIYPTIFWNQLWFVSQLHMDLCWLLDLKNVRLEVYISSRITRFQSCGQNWLQSCGQNWLQSGLQLEIGFQTRNCTVD